MIVLGFDAPTRGTGPCGIVVLEGVVVDDAARIGWLAETQIDAKGHGAWIDPVARLAEAHRADVLAFRTSPGSDEMLLTVMRRAGIKKPIRSLAFKGQEHAQRARIMLEAKQLTLPPSLVTILTASNNSVEYNPDMLDALLAAVAMFFD